METEYEIFNRNWPLYRKLVSNDYMLHKRNSNLTSEWLEKTSLTGPLRILDLGCGDALEISKALKDLPVQSYHGIDLSALVLELAADHLKGVNGVTLTRGAMEIKIGEAGAGFNAVHSSYAIHHLEDGQKIQLLKSIHASLKPNGVLILIDIFRKPGQDRENYIDRYVELMRTHWTKLLPSDIQSIVEHITSSDYPSMVNQFLEWMSECSFELIQSFNSNEQHKMFIFRKP